MLLYKCWLSTLIYFTFVPLNPTQLANEVSRSTSVAKSVITIGIVMLLLAFFRIFLHYSKLGFFEFIIFDAMPKWVILIVPCFFLFKRLLKKNLSITIVAIDFSLTFVGFYIIYFVVIPHNLDDLDWKINYTKRQKIVALLKEGNLMNARTGSYYTLPDSLSLFPFKGQQVAIQTLEDTLITVTFYTDRGIIDHYSGFIYTNNPDDIKSLDEKVKEGGNDFKKEDNWYFIHD